MHSVLQSAHDAASPEHRPPPPFHLGLDANPQLGSFGFCGTALFLTEAIEQHVTAAERPQVDRWLAISREVYQGHLLAQGRAKKQGTKTKYPVLSATAFKQLRAEAIPRRGFQATALELPTPSSVALTAAYAALDAEQQAGGTEVTQAVRRAVTRVVKALPARDVRPFLLELDRRLLREELRAVFVSRRDARAAKVAACVWRAGAGHARGGRAAGAKVTHWLGRFDDRQPVLVWKAGPRWEIVTGEADHVLAHLPEAHLREALAALTST